MQTNSSRGNAHPEAVVFLTDECFTREEALVHWSETQPWNTFRLSMTKLLPLTPHIAVITYRVVATRDRVLEPYRARCTSVHPLREDIWKLPFREQIALPPLLWRLAVPSPRQQPVRRDPAQHVTTPAMTYAKTATDSPSVAAFVMDVAREA
ncbi:hypothetical protein [Amycolatopsis japonica]|uniref:hypothetical protein n=1 Tax=Amycolatopsis japonica TaxID=208439 RepID=UPI0011DD6EBE|nr:hypothetical protein [Amycolatopsis japonica]